MLAKKKYMICLMIIFNYSLLYCQTIHIFKDDSILIGKCIKTFTTEFDSFLSQSHSIIPPSDFKDNLPDGEYIYFWLSKNDSSRKKIDDYIYYKGSFKDSMRNGRFEYYSLVKIKNKWVNKLTLVYNYKKGLLDGYYMANSSNNIYEEGYYKEGKRNGFFITYDVLKNNHISKLELFEDDILKYSVVFKNGEMQDLDTYPCPLNNFKIGSGHNLLMRSSSPCYE